MLRSLLLLHGLRVSMLWPLDLSLVESVQLVHYCFPILIGAVLFLPDHVEVSPFAVGTTNYQSTKRYQDLGCGFYC